MIVNLLKICEHKSMVYIYIYIYIYIYCINVILGLDFYKVPIVREIFKKYLKIGKWKFSILLARLWLLRSLLSCICHACYAYLVCLETKNNKSVQNTPYQSMPSFLFKLLNNNLFRCFNLLNNSVFSFNNLLSSRESLIYKISQLNIISNNCLELYS